ncbi:MAG: CAP domain-containing protein [Deltaproteobacteria bacterium]|nr:CAP domain-containing protein [Deltaproteobacteria bacterium]
MLLILALPACIGGGGGSGGGTGPLCVADAGADGDLGLGCGPTPTDAAVGQDGGDASAAGDGLVSGPRTAAQVCARWNADRQHLDEGAWNGNLAQCKPGILSDAARQNTLIQVNLMRHLAQLPEVLDDPDRNTTAQACALMMHANNALSHTPPTTWKCYTALGAQGAKTSNISSGPAVAAVQSYMIDSGANNAKTLGHRRWILSNSLGPIGIGGTSAQGSSCLLVIGGQGKFTRPFTAWPAPGPFPIQAMSSGSASIDQTGWSVQTDQINLGTSKVAVSANGKELPVVTTVLGQGYGAKYALSWKPQGWKSQAGVTYTVTIDKVGPKPWTYDVQMVDCAAAP